MQNPQFKVTLLTKLLGLWILLFDLKVICIFVLLKGQDIRLPSSIMAVHRSLKP